MEEDGVIGLIEDGDICVKEHAAAMVAEQSNSEQCVLKVGMILPLQTGSVRRRWSAWATEWWQVPTASVTVEVGA